MEYRIDSSESLLPPSEARAAAPFNLILKLLQRYFFYVSYYFFTTSRGLRRLWGIGRAIADEE